MTPNSSIQTDPTYLRYIVDGLENQSLHRDGIASLPDGLIGIYEEAIPNDRQLGLRERFLDFFAIWALLKKEVSVSFILPLFHWEPQVVMDFLSLHTKWFNTPSSGKYLLYHDRLRVYLLERIPTHKLDKTNRKIIATCQSALQQPSGDEWEQYALEHLPSHLIIPAMQHDADGTVFKQLVNDTAFWNRQLEVSKGYDWTKKMLNQSMAWAAKQNTDELIGFALNKVDLHYMEQNDAPRIVELVAQNDLDTALQRIEAFGGNDKEGLQRKFTLYMLCLMELTLLGSKDKPFRRSAIERLLNHFDEKLPTDHSILNWNDFFPSYLMFQMACEWEEMGLDYLRVYKRTDGWESDWIVTKRPYSYHRIEILFECMVSIESEIKKRRARYNFCLLAETEALEKLCDFIRNIRLKKEKEYCISRIISSMIEIDKLDEALKFYDENKYDININLPFGELSEKFAKRGNMERATENAHNISDIKRKIHAFLNISHELNTRGNNEKAIEIIYEAEKNIPNVTNLIDRIEILSSVSTHLFINGKIDQSKNYFTKAIYLTSQIDDQFLDRKKSILLYLSNELIKQNKNQDAQNLLEKFDIKQESDTQKNILFELIEKGKIENAFNIINSEINEKKKNEKLYELVEILTSKGNIQSAILCALKINDSKIKCEAFIFISLRLFENGEIFQAIELIKEALTCARNIFNNYQKVKYFVRISSEISRYGNENEAKDLIRESLKIVKNNCIGWEIISSYKEIYNVLFENEDLKSISIIFYDILAYVAPVGSNYDVSEVIKIFMSYQYSNSSKIQSSFIPNLFSSISLIESEFYKCLTLSQIANMFSQSEREGEAMVLINYSIDYFKKIDNYQRKLTAMQSILIGLIKLKKINDVSTVLNETLSFIEKFRTRATPIHRLFNGFFKSLFNGGLKAVALTAVNSLNDEYVKQYALSEISNELMTQGQFQEALSCLKVIPNPIDISILFARQGKVDDTLTYINQIEDKWKKCITIASISTEFANQNKLSVASDLLDEATYISSIMNNYDMIRALEKISHEMAKQGKFEQALECIQKIKDDDYKSIAQDNICMLLIEKGEMEKAIYYAFEITNEKTRCKTLSKISIEYVKNNDWQSAEEIAIKISRLSDRHKCWKEIALLSVKLYGREKSLTLLHKLQSEEAKLFYVLGWSESLLVVNVNYDFIFESLPLFIDNTNCIEEILRKYAMAQVILDNPSEELLQRLNKTLNIQWVIDIRDKIVA